MLDKTTCETTYQGGEGSTVFPIPFPFLEKCHIQAVRNGADGKAILTPGVDYVINLISEAYGELVLLGEALAAGNTLTIVRRVPLTQEHLFHNQGATAPKVIEKSLDKLTMISQQLQTRVDQALLAPSGSVPEETVALLTAAADLATRLDGKVAGLDTQVGGLTGATARMESDVATLKTQTAGLLTESATHVKEGDARLANRRVPLEHSMTHAVSGSDRITPEAIGGVRLPARDGKLYLLSGAGYIEYTGGPGSGSGEGVGDHALLLNRGAPEQHPQSAICNLEEDLAGINQDLNAMDSALGLAQSALAGKAGVGHGHAVADVAELQAVLDGKAGTAHNHAVAEVTGLQANLNAKAPLASPAFTGTPTAPTQSAADNSTRLATTAFVKTAVSGAPGLAPGMLGLFMQRKDALPAGWYYPSGDYVAQSSARGQALSALPANLKSDWGITVSGSNIRLCDPDKFFAVSSFGRFLRPINGVDRLPGSLETDAMRDLPGSLLMHSYACGGGSGIFYPGTPAAAYPPVTTGSITGYASVTLKLAGNIGSTQLAEEIRPYNVGVTPAIYLGV